MIFFVEKEGGTYLGIGVRGEKNIETETNYC